MELWEYALPTQESPVCAFTFFNLGTRPIASIQLTVTCVDAKGEVITRRVERPMALDAPPRASFVVSLPMDDPEIHAVDLSIDKAWFEDGSEWRRAQDVRLLDYTPNELPPNRRLEQLRYVAGSDAVGYPSDQDAVWVCVCGRVNAAEDDHCRRCLREKALVFGSFTPHAVQEAIDKREAELEQRARSAREEASRQQFLRQEKQRRLKRRRRTRTAIACVTLVLIATAYLFVVLGMPELQYQTALADLEAGKVQEARQAFVELLDYRDAPTRVRACDLHIAKEMAASGVEATVEDALELLATLGTYPGVEAAITEATYQKALLLLERKAYDDAIPLLQGLGDYQEAKTLRQGAEYEVALALLDAGSYDEASQRFVALGGYRDAAAQAKECIYRPAMALMTEARYDEAVVMFASLTGYRDADEQRQQCIYQSAVRAQLSGDYAYAAERFRLLGDYSNAHQQVQHSIYLAANTNYDAGDYETAKGLYEQITGYEDAAVRLQDCIYQPACALMAAGQYAEAAAQFLLLPGYLDADDLYRQCLYLPAETALLAASYQEAIDLLEQVPGYENADDLLLQARYGLAAQIEATGAYEQAIAAFDALGEYSDAKARANAARYAHAEAAFALADYELASARFAALGDYEDAAVRVKACAYELAAALEATDPEAAYTALTAIEGYAPAAEKAAGIAYAQAELLVQREQWEAAAAQFERAGDYLDAAERRKECIYNRATDLFNEDAYQSSGDLFATIPDYKDAANKSVQSYDVWLYARAEKARKAYETGDYQLVIDTLYGLTMAEIPEEYGDLIDAFYDSNLKIARQLVNADRPLEAYPYLMAAKDQRGADSMLDKNIYKLPGTWETNAGVRYAFYLDGSCDLAGEAGYFNMSGAYAILTGDDPGNLKRTHSFVNGAEDSIAIKIDDAGTTIRLTRIAPAAESAEAQNTEAEEE
jgi:tetratricopeptide (TPR) repeat protein